MNQEEKIKEIKNLVCDFKKKTEEWKIKCPKEDFVFNNDLCNVDDWHSIKYIMVADNPGKKEKCASKYLVSDGNSDTSSGNIAEKIFDYLGIKKNKQFVVLNKCPIFTENTEGLKGKCLLQETQEYMAELTFNLHKSLCELHEQNETKPKVYIFGLGGCHDLEKGWLARKKDGDYYANQTMQFYFEKIKELYRTNQELQRLFFIMKHFSYWNIFSDLLYVQPDNSSLSPRIINGQKVKLSILKAKEIPPAQLVSALEELEYKKDLFNV